MTTTQSQKLAKQIRFYQHVVSQNTAPTGAERLIRLDARKALRRLERIAAA